ncbi:hypothetical protein D3C76_1017400 [compost metagenome]
MGKRVADNQVARFKGAYQNGSIEHVEVLAVGGVALIDIDETGTGLVLVRLPMLFVGSGENCPGHGLLIRVPASRCVDVPQSAQGVRQLIPARLRRGHRLIPVVDLLFSIGHEQ